MFPYEWEEQPDFHKKCSRKFFGNSTPPELDFSKDDLLEMAERIVKTQKIVTGVQPKLSLNTTRKKGSDKERFTLVGLWGEYILKPQTEMYPHLPEIEDATMHLANLYGISTVPHSLIRLKSGELAYITKRIDRSKHGKLHMEDMCQLTERLTEHKYRGSYEQIAKVILKYSQNPGIDVILFYEKVLFSFLTGNSDMHLKNFSLFKYDNIHYRLSPAYDLVATALVVEGDDEELALNLNGKKKKIKGRDFEIAMRTSGMIPFAINNLMKRMTQKTKAWVSTLLAKRTFLPTEMAEQYVELINQRMEQLK